MKTILLLTIIITGMLCGCKTSTQRIEYNSMATVINTVDAAMKTWAIHVKTQRVKLVGNEAGQAALAQNEAKVRAAFEGYQRAANPVLEALKASGTSTTASPPSPDVVAQAAGLQSLISNLTR